ncbi:MAG TPA: YicC/YloC family endoribonuclease, partial [Candidatus Eisenbacteria bacterium]
MVRSMTGYGRGEVAFDGLRLTAEVRSVNHRFCEISARLPRTMSTFEGDVRQLLQSRLTRGKISLVVSWGGDGEEGREPAATLRLDERSAERYMEILASL